MNPHDPQTQQNAGASGNGRRMRLQAALIATALFLNMSGAVISKFIAINIATKIALALGLLALLGANHLCRVFFWVTAGRHFQLSYIYPVLSINYLFSFLLGVAVFREAFEWHRLLGSLIIVAGVACVMITDHQRETTSVD